MKKILLIIALIMAIFQMIVLATAIDIGEVAKNRNFASSPGYTDVNIGNSANATGKINSVEIWAETDITGCEVATFYVVSGNYLSTRDSETISGTITAGAKRTFTVDLDVVVGDFIGMYFTSGKIEYDGEGYGGFWQLSGDNIPCTNTNFGNSYAGDAISLYGTGATSASNAINFAINF